ncbi:MAG: hypothetical protein DRP99_00130 [Candidatus Latescibacterota bacterium]|nr:MAG: hypothetical protein DRP99_00130 [Candidatus Latescibacterota bacterium]
MIEVEGLTKYYGRSPVPAIEDVTFRVEKGEILGFLGPNGAGKTTTMRIITGYFPPSRGTARVAGYDVMEDPTEVKKRVGYLPEHPPLYNDMTVEGFLNFVADIKGLDRSKKKLRIGEVAERCGLDEVMDVRIGKLSKGYRQRVGVAQALVHDPEVLILDEPTIGLDPKQVVEVRNLIKSLAGERTVILSTHILPEVSMTCGRVVIINKGRVVAEDTPENLTARLRGVRTIFVEARGPADGIEKVLREVPDVKEVRHEGSEDGTHRFVVESTLEKDVRAQLASSVVSGGFQLLELRPVGMSLEDIFLQLTTEEGA